MEYGYVRVSTKEQNEQRQMIALREFGIEEKRIFMDKQSGKDFERAKYKKLLRKIKSGDMSFGQSLGYNYVAKFSADGTFVARGMGSGAYEDGTYTYSNGKLVIVFDIDGFGYPSTIEYSGNKDGFTSLDKYPMQVGEDYYTISPDYDGSQFFNESVETDPPIQTEDQSYVCKR